MGEFIKALKGLIARGARPQLISSQVKCQEIYCCTKWINKTNNDEGLSRREEIRWKFNLAKATWWGRQFKGIIELTKQTLYKSLGESVRDMQNNVNKQYGTTGK